MNRSGNWALALACCLLSARTAWGEDVVRSINWQEIAAANALTSGVVVTDPDGTEGSRLRVVHEGPAPATLPLVTIERPGIGTARYALRGRVRYEGVATGSYLEMWNHLPEGAFFSRSLDQSGPMGHLDGSSGWRPFVLPFFNREGGSPPARLVLNLVLAGAGTVEIGPLELVEFAANEDPLADATAWWSDRQAGMLGGIVGSALGLLGAVIGWLGSAGRAKALVLGSLKGIAWLGIGALILGGVALQGGQPYAVYYPLVLLGTVSAALGFSLPRSLRKRYEELELRRMQALDA
ncbi:MAG: hypothetical protein ACRD3C_15230 [Vicinamibacterales bacterium]